MVGQYYSLYFLFFFFVVGVFWVTGMEVGLVAYAGFFADDAVRADCEGAVGCGEVGAEMDVGVVANCEGVGTGGDCQGMKGGYWGDVGWGFGGFGGGHCWGGFGVCRWERRRKWKGDLRLESVALCRIGSRIGLSSLGIFTLCMSIIRGYHTIHHLLKIPSPPSPSSFSIP